MAEDTVEGTAADMDAAPARRTTDVPQAADMEGTVRASGAGS